MALLIERSCSCAVSSEPGLSALPDTPGLPEFCFDAVLVTPNLGHYAFQRLPGMPWCGWVVATTDGWWWLLPPDSGGPASSDLDLPEEWAVWPPGTRYHPHAQHHLLLPDSVLGSLPLSRHRWIRGPAHTRRPYSHPILLQAALMVAATHDVDGRTSWRDSRPLGGQADAVASEREEV